MSRKTDDARELLRDVDAIDNEIGARMDEVAALRERRNGLIAEVRERCVHERVVHFGPHIAFAAESSGCFGTTGHYEALMGPTRVCMDCTFAEFTFVSGDREHLFEGKLIDDVEASAVFETLTAEPVMRLPYGKLEDYARLNRRQQIAFVEDERRKVEETSVAAEDA